MKSSRSVMNTRRARIVAALCLFFVVAAFPALPEWIVNVESKSALEDAFFRLMAMPGGAVLGRRPPTETRPALSGLIKSKPDDAQLYSLRALEDEQTLDFEAAESDWKLFVQKAQDKGAANQALADFYHRRARPADEIRALSFVGQVSSPPSESLTPPALQRSWMAFERSLQVAQAHAMPAEVTIGQYKSWIARYPRERSLYTRYFQYLLERKDAAAAQQVIADYQKAFPEDSIFPVKARALLDYKSGSVEEGLAVYDHAFQPLWPAELVQNFFGLLKETRNTRKFADKWRARLQADPDDIHTLARVFYYYQQAGKLDVAQRTIDEYRLKKEERKAPWSADELYILARLLEQVHAYPESSRYYYALYNVQGPGAQEKALGGLISILLTAPEQPLRLGAGEISLYQDIATLDQGPGFLNGILSLILNTTQPAIAFSQEEQRAVPYFHRAKAAELLAQFDKAFAASPRRPGLHAQLIEMYANYGASDAVIREGRQFLADFPDAPQRTQISLLMADAYSRTKQTREEFAIYDAVILELAKRAQQVPLGPAAPEQQYGTAPSEGSEIHEPGGEIAEASECEEPCEPTPTRPPRASQRAFALGEKPADTQAGPRSPEYSRVLERYLSRLVELKQLPEALAVLRRELDRNPNDPGLYERLAAFLQQNLVGSETEQVYKRAIQQFQDRSWYHKLARWYLAQKRKSDFERLSSDVVRIFAGTELARYFETVVAEADYQIGPQMYLKLNQYAHQRFPHNLTFVNNLLSAYGRKETRDLAAYNRLLREHWMESEALRNQFFASFSGPRLEAELRQAEHELNAGGDWDGAARKDPVETRFIAEAELWRSHFEAAAAPLGAVARVFPADFETGRRASAVYRSLAYFDPSCTERAVGIEQNLLQAAPGDRETLARIGDIYADRERFAEAAPFWNRIPAIEPGNQAGYLDAATIYWDYFDFDNALRRLNDGRAKLARPELYAYEAGAIYEGKRQYPQAIAEYVKGALVQEGYTPARGRLLQLATRPKYKDLVEDAMAKPLASPTPAAIDLRIAVLEAQQRKDDLERFLMGLVERSPNLELLENLQTIAQQRSLESVRQRALERQAELTTDPIRRLELRYELVRFYEGKKDFAAAQRNVEALYREHAKILGVVRATVDFYWRTNQKQPAIDVLLEASKAAYPDLATRFRFEAARKMTDAGQYERARDILLPLLQKEPYDSEYLAAAADTYARAGDDQGLRKFYLDKIAFLQAAPDLDAAAKTSHIAALRRGLIPALTRLKDYSGAVDQYMAILNSYPEDQGLATEAAYYAVRYSLHRRLLDFYGRTVEQSPRDVRWAVVLARLQADFEDYPAAVDAYGRALRVRPDRTDLWIARAGLLERLMRFDEAAADYQKLYDLQYKDPKWMEKLAELRARQGKADAAVPALKLALLEGRPEQPQNYFNVAQRLEGWGMLAQAREFADRGMKLAGQAALSDGQNHGGALLWTRILTRQRKQDEAWKKLETTFASVSKSVDGVLASVFPDSDENKLKRAAEMARRASARRGLASALQQMGETVDKYFVPEEREQFAAYLGQKRAATATDDVEDLLIPLAQAAHLPELEVRWRYEMMQQDPEHAGNHMFRLVQLQTQRLRFQELGAQMENMATRSPQSHRGSYWLAAAHAYQTSEDWQSELRVLGAMRTQNLLGGEVTRYYEILLAHAPQTLVGLAGSGVQGERDASANFILSHADSRLAQSAIAVRGRGLPPVWTHAYTGLVGLYFRDTSPEVDGSFRAALGQDTIGQSLGKPVERAQRLAGDIWFYYGGRYGEYLGNVTRKENAEDYLPASLEQTPGGAYAYEALADYYSDSGDLARAVADYDHALELGPDNPEIHDKLAVVYWKQNDRAQARAHWRHALRVLLRQIDLRQVPESFWRDFGGVMEHIGSRKLFSEFRGDVDALLRAYVRKNGTWRNTALLRDAYRAMGDDAAGVPWLLDLAGVAPNPSAVVAEFVDDKWIPQAQKESIYRRMLQYSADRLSASQGMARDYARQDYLGWRRRWVQFLLDTRQYERARTELESARNESETAAAFVPLQLFLDAAQNRLDATLDGYRADPEHAPSLDTLRAVASELQEKNKDKASARKLLEYVFTREIQEHALSSANLLGLAEIRLEAGDLKGALELLHRATLVIGKPFENLDAAASLLLKTGYPGEAVEFLDTLVKAEPWNAEARLKLAQAKLKAGQDVGAARAAIMAIARSPIDVRYATRLAAAAAAAPSAEHIWGSNELRLIGSGAPINAAEANRSFFYEARLKAAAAALSPEPRMQLLRAALEDFPDRDTARLPMFRATVAAKQDRLALAALGSRMGALPGHMQGGGNEEEEARLAELDVASTSNQMPKLSVEERAAVAAEVASVLERLDRSPDALRFLQVAVRLEPAPQKKAAMQKQIASLRAQIRRREQNEARRPVIHPALEQGHAVRPMLVVRSAPPAAAKPRRTP